MSTRPDLYLYEEIMLLALRDKAGKPAMGSMYKYALGGALLAELLVSSRIRLVEKKNYVQVIDAAPFGDRLLDEALDAIHTAKRRKKARDWVPKLSGIKQLGHKAVMGLCNRGILREDEKTILLIFKQKLYPELDHEPEREIIERLREAIDENSAHVPERTIVLLGLAHATDLLGMVFDKKELKAHKKRIERLMEETEIGRVTRDVVEAARVAVIAASTAAAVG